MEAVVYWREFPLGALQNKQKHLSLGLGVPHGRQRGTDRVVGHRKELFLWPLAFECATSIFPLGNGEQPWLEDPKV